MPEILAAVLIQDHKKINVVVRASLAQVRAIDSDQELYELITSADVFYSLVTQSVVLGVELNTFLQWLTTGSTQLEKNENHFYVYELLKNLDRASFQALISWLCSQEEITDKITPSIIQQNLKQAWKVSKH